MKTTEKGSFRMTRERNSNSNMKTEKCPVCGSRRADPESVCCGRCGFSLAFVDYFADRKSLEDYRSRLAAAREAYLTTDSFSGRFAISADAVGVVGRSGRLLFWDSVCGINETDGISGISIGGEHIIVLDTDGRVMSFGHGVYGQCRTSRLPPMRYAAAGDRCSVFIDRKGKPRVTGLSFPGLKNDRSGVKKAAAGDGFILMLYGDGTAETLTGTDCHAVFGRKKLDGIVDIAAGGCAMFLDRNGKVTIDGVRNGDTRLRAREWNGIRAIAADSGFVYGVDGQGRVHCAGKCPAGFDRGRSEASEWTDVEAITCGRSCVAALTRNGDVRYAGIFSPHFAEALSEFSGRLRGMMGK